MPLAADDLDAVALVLLAPFGLERSEDLCEPTAKHLAARAVPVDGRGERLAGAREVVAAQCVQPREHHLDARAPQALRRHLAVRC